jgi:hypothetical protein
VEVLAGRVPRGVAWVQNIREVGGKGSGHDPAIMVSLIDFILLRRIPRNTYPSPAQILLSDVKMKIRGSYGHVPNPVADPGCPQNASMCVSLLGDFWQVFGEVGWGGIREDRRLEPA